MKLPKYLAWPELTIGSTILIIGLALMGTQPVSCIFFCAEMLSSFLAVVAGGYVVLLGVIVFIVGVIRTIVQFVLAKKSKAH